MAQKVHVALIDDLDASPADETIRFGLDGRDYEIDLSEANAKALRDSLASYVEVARRPTGTQKQQVRSDPQVVQAMRSWANEHGYTVANRGRIPHAVAEAYRQAS